MKRVQLMSNNRYNKIIKFQSQYLQVASPIPVIQVKQRNLSNISDDQLHQIFGPQSFVSVPNIKNATIFTLSQATIIEEAFKQFALFSHQPVYSQISIQNIGPNIQSLNRQLNHITVIHNKQNVRTVTTSDFDTLERFKQYESNMSDPQVSSVWFDSSKYIVKSITVRSEYKKAVLANIIDKTASSVKVLANPNVTQSKIPFAVDVINKETNQREQLGQL